MMGCGSGRLSTARRLLGISESFSSDQYSRINSCLSRGLPSILKPHLAVSIAQVVNEYSGNHRGDCFQPHLRIHHVSGDQHPVETLRILNPHTTITLGNCPEAAVSIPGIGNSGIHAEIRALSNGEVNVCAVSDRLEICLNNDIMEVGREYTLGLKDHVTIGAYRITIGLEDTGTHAELEDPRADVFWLNAPDSRAILPGRSVITWVDLFVKRSVVRVFLDDAFIRSLGSVWIGSGELSAPGFYLSPWEQGVARYLICRALKKHGSPDRFQIGPVTQTPAETLRLTQSAPYLISRVRIKMVQQLFYVSVSLDLATLSVITSTGSGKPACSGGYGETRIRMILGIQAGHLSQMEAERICIGDSVLLSAPDWKYSPDTGFEGPAVFSILSAETPLTVDIYFSESAMQCRIVKPLRHGGEFEMEKSDALQYRESGSTDSSTDQKIHDVENLQLPVIVELDRIKLPLRRIFRLEAGQIIQLQRKPGEDVRLRIGSRYSAQGQLVMVGEFLAVQVTRLTADHPMDEEDS